METEAFQTSLELEFKSLAAREKALFSLENSQHENCDDKSKCSTEDSFLFLSIEALYVESLNLVQCCR